MRWGAPAADARFADQAAVLHTAHHLLRITIHRPFIPVLRRAAPQPFPAFAICTSAARACVQVLDTHFRRYGAERVAPACQVSPGVACLGRG